MKNNQLLNAVAEMSSALSMINKVSSIDKLHMSLEAVGYTTEQLVEIQDFIDREVTEKEVIEIAEKNAFSIYIERLAEIKRIMDVMKGYQDMGMINLSISEEAAHAESQAEGIVLNAVEGTVQKKEA